MYDAVLDVLPYGIVFVVAFCAMASDTMWVCAFSALVAVISAPLVTVGIVPSIQPDVPTPLTISMAIIAAGFVALYAIGRLQDIRAHNSIK